MSSPYIDITFPVSSQLPIWPGSVGYAHQWHVQMGNGAGHNASSFTIDSHLGTHLDAPLHFVHGGKAVRDVSLDVLIGEAYVVEVSGKRSITADDLEQLAIPADCQRLLLKTDNQLYWEQGKTTFQEDFCSIDHSGARWIVARGIKLVGIDYLSIQRYYDGPEVHQALLNAEVVIVEMLDLRQVSAGKYELICLPLRLEELEGCPVRAVLKRI